jgi:hypothetical protein
LQAKFIYRLFSISRGAGSSIRFADREAAWADVSIGSGIEIGMGKRMVDELNT